MFYYLFEATAMFLSIVLVLILVRLLRTVYQSQRAAAYHQCSSDKFKNLMDEHQLDEVVAEELAETIKWQIFDANKHSHSEACRFWFLGCYNWAFIQEKYETTGGYFDPEIGRCNYGNDF